MLKRLAFGVLLMSSLGACLGIQQQLVDDMDTMQQNHTMILKGVHDRKTADEASIKIKKDLAAFSNDSVDAFMRGEKSAFRIYCSSLLPSSTSGVKKSSENVALQVERLEKAHCYGSKSLQKIFRENIILKKYE